MTEFLDCGTDETPDRLDLVRESASSGARGPARGVCLLGAQLLKTTAVCFFLANGQKELKRLTCVGVLGYHVDLRIVKIFLFVYTPPHPCWAELVQPEVACQRRRTIAPRASRSSMSPRLRAS